jgi:hypothetical protein
LDGGGKEGDGSDEEEVVFDAVAYRKELKAKAKAMKGK